MGTPLEDLKVGVTLNNSELCQIFSCSSQGGMRRSLTTGSLVIVSNHIKSIYDDRWIEDTFHYTGMGTKGDQSLKFSQNKTLAESETNGVEIYLFEVFVEKEYSFTGKVVLADTPYFETQPDETGLLRKACVFPLKIKDGNALVIDRDYSNKPFQSKSRKARKLNDQELENRAKNANRSVGSRNAISLQYTRNPWVAEYAKRVANGVCQLCENQAPFKNEDGEPFLETHHIVWLAQGGEDTIENTVALCPNCHRRMHILNDKTDVELLLAKKKK